MADFVSNPTAARSPDLNEAKLRAYRAHARQRAAVEQEKLQQFYQKGMEQAHHAAGLLKTEFGVTEVYLFGSFLDPDAIHFGSDLDLAVRGLGRDRYCEAVGHLLCKINGLSIDLIRLEDAPPSLSQKILSQGKTL